MEPDVRVFQINLKQFSDFCDSVHQRAAMNVKAFGGALIVSFFQKKCFQGKRISGMVNGVICVFSLFQYRVQDADGGRGCQGDAEYRKAENPLFRQ